MSHAVARNQRLDWTGKFKCETCKGTGMTAVDVSCNECDGDGFMQLECELVFDILPAIPPTGMSGPYELADPGCGAEVHKMIAFVYDVDQTAALLNADDAEEFIVDKWAPPEPDYPDYAPED